MRSTNKSKLLDNLSLEVLDKYLSVKVWHQLSKSKIPYLVNKYRNLFPSINQTMTSGHGYAIGITNDGMVIGWGEKCIFKEKLLNIQKKIQKKKLSFIAFSFRPYFMSMGLTEDNKIYVYETFYKRNDPDRYVGLKNYHKYQGNFISISYCEKKYYCLTNDGKISRFICCMFSWTIFFSSINKSWRYHKLGN